MKHIYFILTLVLLFSFLLIPLAAVEGKSQPAQNENAVQTLTPKIAAEKTEEQNFDVYNPQSKKLETLTAENYLLGVLAAEMPADYEPEALKAQAVAAYTFALYKKEQNRNESYDITVDHTVDQGYLTAEERAKKWGNKTAEYESKLLAAIRATANCTLLYQSKPILAVYHAISGGNTESAKNVWGTDFPYLIPCISTGDLLCPDYLSEVKIAATDFKTKLQSLGCKPEDNFANYIGEAEKTASGTVLTQNLCGQKLSGSTLREAFALRSANFDLNFKENSFIFTVKGYGHGVGLSQYGAQYLAQQGNTFEEILAQYYPGTDLKKE